MVAIVQHSGYPPATKHGNGESPMIELVIQDMTYDMLNQWTWCIRFSCLRITRYWWLNVAMEKWWLHGPVTDVFSYENLVILHSYVIPLGTGTGFYPKTAVRVRENHHAFKVWSFYVETAAIFSSYPCGCRKKQEKSSVTNHDFGMTCHHVCCLTC